MPEGNNLLARESDSRKGLFFKFCVIIVTSMIGEQFLRLPSVESLIGLRRSKIYGMIGEGSFPRQVKLGHTSVWRRSEVAEWMHEQVHATRS